jgi:membrane fusion protein, multidrug efflux system
MKTEARAIRDNTIHDGKARSLVSALKLSKLLIVVAMAALVWACERAPGPVADPVDPAVSVIHPQRCDMVRSIDLPGDVVGFYEAALHAKVTGYLQSISVDKGDWVKTGQVLAQIQVPELDSNLARAQASLEIAKITYDRLKHVQQSDARLISQEDVDMARAKYDEAQASVRTLDTMVAYTKIVAPFDGVITGRFADPGALIRAGGGDYGTDETSGLISPGATEGAGGHREGGGPILTLADIDKLRIYIYVPEASYPSIRRGTPAILHFDEFPGRVFKGSVARFATSLDLSTRTMLTEVDIDNQNHVLYPRSYAHVTLDLIRHADVLSLPAAAIEGSGDSSHVFLVKDGLLADVPVSTGITEGSRVEVTSGLTDQSLVVDTYSNALSSGEKVRFILPKLTHEANSPPGSDRPKGLADQSPTPNT